jgi:hypothetical protein
MTWQDSRLEKERTCASSLSKKEISTYIICNFVFLKVQFFLPYSGHSGILYSCEEERDSEGREKEGMPTIALHAHVRC